MAKTAKQPKVTVLTDEQMREYMHLYNNLVGVESHDAIDLYKKCHDLLQVYGDGYYKKNQKEQVVLENPRSPVFEDFGDMFIDEIDERGKKIDLKKSLFHNVLNRFLNQQVTENHKEEEKEVELPTEEVEEESIVETPVEEVVDEEPVQQPRIKKQKKHTVIKTRRVHSDEPKQEIDEPIYEEDPKEEVEQEKIEEQPVEEVIEDKPVQEEQEVVITRERSLNSDANEFRQDRLVVDIYVKMGKLPEDDYSNRSSSELLDLITAVGTLKPKEAKQFEQLFAESILEKPELIEQLPPKVVTSVYEYVKKSIKTEKDQDKQQKLESDKSRLCARIDFLINDFDKVYEALSFVDNTNTPDVYAGYKKMLDSRESDESAPAEIVETIKKDRAKLEEVYTAYKKYYNIDWLTPKDAPKLDERLAKVQKQLDSMNVSTEYMLMSNKYSFLDSEGAEEPQFIGKDGRKYLKYEEGKVIDPKGRLYSIIQLAKQSVAMQHLDGKPIDKRALQEELDEQFMITLYSTAKNHGINVIVKEKEEQLANPENKQVKYDESKTLEEIKEELSNNGGTIDKESFENAMDNQCNRVAGFAQCVDQETRKPEEESKTGNFFTKLFKPIQQIDKRAKDRLQEDSRSAKRLSRLNLLARVAKMFGCGFLASLLLTFSASATGQLLGVSSTTIGAVIGGSVAVGFSIGHIVSWVRQRKAKDEPHGFKDFLKDPRMLAALAPTLLMLASFACLAAGMLPVAKWLGRAAMLVGATLGGTNLGIDARNSGYGKLESVVWGIAGFFSTFGGGLAGRAAGVDLAKYLGDQFPEIFKEKTETTIIHESEEYDPRALDNARHICEQWYQDNPTELQHRVDLVNQYNASHGTTIDPYRAIMLSADAGGQTFDNMRLHVDGGGVQHSGGHHTVFGAEWQQTNGYSASEINSLAHMFDGGQIDPSGLNVATRIDPSISIHNEVGVVPSSDQIMHHDHVLWDNYTNTHTGDTGFNTYNGGDSPFIHNEVIENVVSYTQDINPMLGGFGMYQDKVMQPKLKDRVGAFADRLHETFRPKPGPIDPIIIKEKKIYINRANAKKWLETPEKLDVVIQKLHGEKPEVLRYRVAEALRRKRKTDNQIINTIRNQYPDLSDEEIDAAVAETFRRELLETVIQRYQAFEAGEESFQHNYRKDLTNPRHKEREQERQWWQDLINALGGEESLNDSEYYYSKREKEQRTNIGQESIVQSHDEQIQESCKEPVVEIPVEEKSAAEGLHTNIGQESNTEPIVITPVEEKYDDKSAKDLFKRLQFGKGKRKLGKRMLGSVNNFIKASEKI